MCIRDSSSAVSVPVTLTILPDVQAPKLLSLRGLAGLNQIRLVFDERLDRVSATAVGNYKVGGVDILAATLSEDGTSVTLQSSALQKGQAYQVSISGVKDGAQAH